MRIPVLASLLSFLAGCNLMAPIAGPPPGTCEDVFQPGAPLQWASTGTLEDFGLEDPADPIPPGPGQIFVGMAAEDLWVEPVPDGADLSRVVCVVTRENGRTVSYGGPVPEGWEPP